MRILKLTKRPKVGIGVLVRRDGKILLHKRKSEHAYGTWACPGGHLEMFETFLESGIRELEEEAGSNLKVTESRLWTVCNTHFPEEDRHYVVVFLLCDYVSGEAQVMEPEKAECWKWFDWNNLPEPLIQGSLKLKMRGKNPVDVNYNSLPSAAD